MKLLTKANLRSLPPLNGTDGLGEDAKATVKFFCPWNGWTWYATEYDPEEKRFFGLVYGQEMELGYWSLDEMAEMTGPWGLRIERDMHFRAATLREIKEAEDLNRNTPLYREPLYPVSGMKPTGWTPPPKGL